MIVDENLCPCIPEDVNELYGKLSTKLNTTHSVVIQNMHIMLVQLDGAINPCAID
jgi:hypothetical protein